MSAYTLLEIVQDVHNDLNLDEVNTIGDTPDSLRVAQIAKTTFFEFIAQRDSWPHLKALTRLQALSDVTQKTGVIIPDNTSKILWIKYDCIKDGETRSNYQEIKYLYPDEFISRAHELDNTASNVEEIVTPDEAVFYVRTDKAPQYWTSFDDRIVYFDSIDESVDSTIQAHKTQVYRTKIPTWTAEDDFVPELPVEAFPGYIAEVKSVASIAINETQNGKAEQQATRQRRKLSNQAWKAQGGIRYPDYGRNPRASRFHRNWPRD
jgi:hypothetical protein